MLKDGRSVGWNESIDKGTINSELKIAVMSLSIENVGMIPTEKLYVKISYLDSLTKDELWRLGITTLQPYPLVPGEKLSFSYEIKAEDYFKLNKKKHRYGIHVGYFINNKESCTIGKIWEIKMSGVGTVEYWMDEPKI